MSSRFAPALTILSTSLLAGVSVADTDAETVTVYEEQTEVDTTPDGVVDVAEVADEQVRIYLEQDGIVLFEVEDTHPGEGWELKTELDGFRGSGYFEWTGPNRFPVRVAGRGATKYHFRIETPGNYQLRLRNRIAFGDSNTEHNDSWVRLATGTNIFDEQPIDDWIKSFSNTSGVWNWATKTVDHVGNPIRQYFTQGDHTVEISGRSQGHAIDQIALYRYEDVPFAPHRANNWDLSPYVLFDGTVVQPPPEPVVEEPVVASSPVNLALAPESWLDLQSNTCVANTLAIAATDIATFSPSYSSIGYTRGEFASLTNGLSELLVSFDTSLVPPFTSAILEYSTGDIVAEGELTYVLGSHNQWQLGTSELTEAPQFLLELGRASGGWVASSRYQSTLQADLLMQGMNTLIVRRSTGTDGLSIATGSTSALAPRLLLTGDESFCANWQANVDAANLPIEAPAEINEETGESEESTDVDVNVDVEQQQPDTEVNTESRSNDASLTSRGTFGGATSWLMLSVVGLLLINRRRRTA